MKWRDIDLSPALGNGLVLNKIRFVLAGTILIVNFLVPINVNADTLTLLPDPITDARSHAKHFSGNDKATDLTLRDAINLALLQNPDLAAFAKEMRALE